MARWIRKRVLTRTAGTLVALAAAAAPSAPLTLASPVAFGVPASAAAGGATPGGQPPADGGGPRVLPQPPGVVAGSPFAAPGTVLPGGSGAGNGAGTSSTVPVTPATSLSVGGARLPATVFAAYRSAETSLAGSDPGCHLPWQLLAGIGQVESGQADGGAVDASGTTYTPILGPALDGTSGFAAIPNSTSGAYDGSGSWARAVGPMQFLPSTWATWGADGNGDGKADPNNIWDAALGAGRYLCAGGRDVSVPAQLDRAILSYNNSTDYLNTVKSWMGYFQTGALTVPDLPAGPGPVTVPLPVGGGLFTVVPASRPSASSAPSAPATPIPAGTPAGTPSASPTPNAQPSPAAPTASPTPASPSASASPNPAASASASASPTPAPSASPTPSAKPSPTTPASPSPTGSPSPSPTASPTGTPSPAPTGCPTPTAGASASPSPSPTGTPSPAPTPSPKPSGTPTPSASATPGSPAPSGSPSPSCGSPSPAPTAAAPTSSPSPSPSASAK